MTTAIRSLRSIRIDSLHRRLGRVVRDQDLGCGTEEFATSARAVWRDLAEGRTSAITAGVTCVEARRLCVDATAAEIRAAILVLDAVTDDAYTTATAELPLSYWGLTPETVGPYAFARGIEGRAWYERFDGFGAHRMDHTDGPGMGGYGWFRVGTTQGLTRSELLPILGEGLIGCQASCYARGAAQWLASRSANSH